MDLATIQATYINITAGKIVTVSFDALAHQDFEILDPKQTIICNNKSDSNTPFLFENQCFITKITGKYTIVIKSNNVTQKVTLTESNEFFGTTSVSKYYTFKSSEDAEISLVINS